MVSSISQLLLKIAWDNIPEKPVQNLLHVLAMVASHQEVIEGSSSPVHQFGTRMPVLQNWTLFITNQLCTSISLSLIWGLKYHPPQPWHVWLGWASSCKPKVRWFNFPSGHMPGLWQGPQFGHMQVAANGCFSPSLPLSLKINKSLKYHPAHPAHPGSPCLAWTSWLEHHPVHLTISLPGQGTHV